MSDGLRDYTADCFEDRGGGGDSHLGGAFLFGLLAVMSSGAGFGVGFVSSACGGIPGTVACSVVLGVLNGVMAFLAFRVLKVASWMAFVLVGGGFALTVVGAYLCGSFCSDGDGLSFASYLRGTWEAGLGCQIRLVVTAAVLLVGTFAVAGFLNGRSLFCEACGRWAGGRRVLKALYLCVPEGAAFALLAKGVVSPLLSASPVASGTTGIALDVLVRFCTGCRRGAMWVWKTIPGGRRRSILSRVELGADAVRSILEISR